MREKGGRKREIGMEKRWRGGGRFSNKKIPRATSDGEYPWVSEMKNRRMLGWIWRYHMRFGFGGWWEMEKRDARKRV